MNSNQNINVTFEDIFIKEVDFHRSQNMEMKSYNIECVDSIRVSSADENGFRLEYTRKTVTKEPFFFTVVFECYCRLNQKSKDILGGDTKRIELTAEKHKEGIVANLNLPSKASLVIADITSHLGTPYLSRPFLIK